MDDKRKQFVDELVAASLRCYSSAEARPGLEGRILAGVRSRQQAERRRKLFFWIVGMAGAAAVVVMLVLTWPHRQLKPAPVIAKAPAIVSLPTVAKNVPPVQPPMGHAQAQHATPGKVDTRPQQFPTPRPLSEQEKLMVEYVRLIQNSPGAAAPVANRSPEADLEIPPLTIADIKFDPLPSLSNGNEKQSNEEERTHEN
jgi:hypothetical protein